MSGAANGRAGEEYQVRARYQVRANALLRQLSAPAGVPPPTVLDRAQTRSQRRLGAPWRGAEMK